MGQFLLDLRLGPGPWPAGRIGCPGGPTHSFHGWLELMALVEQLRAGDPPVVSPEPGGS